ncbi:HNH endonuclease [Kitasatospora sp. NPDC051914]|uniref:HNH endonuclease n=1 Tax=Kitasatospora sp. NPDC051914 TaxID=3154945 RepID=UPI0034454199
MADDRPPMPSPLESALSAMKPLSGCVLGNPELLSLLGDNISDRETAHLRQEREKHRAQAADGTAPVMQLLLEIAHIRDWADAKRVVRDEGWPESMAPLDVAAQRFHRLLNVTLLCPDSHKLYDSQHNPFDARTVEIATDLMWSQPEAAHPLRKFIDSLEGRFGHQPDVINVGAAAGLLQRHHAQADPITVRPWQKKHRDLCTAVHFPADGGPFLRRRSVSARQTQT